MTNPANLYLYLNAELIDSLLSRLCLKFTKYIDAVGEDLYR